MSVIQMWHGGRSLETDYREDKPSRSGKWEHGPGLYLTTSYARASKYAKGGGSTYLVTVESGNDMHDIFMPVNEAIEFVKGNAAKRVQDEIIERIKSIGDGDKVRATYVMNNLVNADAIKSSKTVDLQKFLVAQGVDYAMVKRYGGGEEDVLVVMNKRKILSVAKVSARELDMSMYDLPFEFLEQKEKRSTRFNI